MFNKYKEELSNEDKIESCENQSTKKGDFNLMIHQRVVRDYLNLYTPYRGLLLYHGLGSGKTCTSIAIAEGMKSQKKIYVMTLASLKANFFDQMKVCGDPLYKLDQSWEFVSIDGNPDYIPIFSNVFPFSSLADSIINFPSPSTTMLGKKPIYGLDSHLSNQPARLPHIPCRPCKDLGTSQTNLLCSRKKQQHEPSHPQWTCCSPQKPKSRLFACHHASKADSTLSTSQPVP